MVQLATFNKEFFATYSEFGVVSVHSTAAGKELGRLYLKDVAHMEADQGTCSLAIVTSDELLVFKVDI